MTSTDIIITARRIAIVGHMTRHTLTLCRLRAHVISIWLQPLPARTRSLRVELIALSPILDQRLLAQHLWLVALLLHRRRATRVVKIFYDARTAAHSIDWRPVDAQLHGEIEHDNFLKLAGALCADTIARLLLRKVQEVLLARARDARPIVGHNLRLLARSLRPLSIAETVRHQHVVRFALTRCRCCLVATTTLDKFEAVVWTWSNRAKLIALTRFIMIMR